MPTIRVVIFGSETEPEIRQAVARGTVVYIQLPMPLTPGAAPLTDAQPIVITKVTSVPNRMPGVLSSMDGAARIAAGANPELRRLFPAGCEVHLDFHPGSGFSGQLVG